MKNQGLFSLKDKCQKIICRLLQFLFGALRVNSMLLVCFMFFWQKNERKYRSRYIGDVDILQLQCKSMRPRVSEFIPCTLLTLHYSFDWFVACFGFNGSFRQNFSLSLSYPLERGRKKKDREE